MIGKLGIDNKTHVVLVPPGTSSTDMASAPASTGPSRSSVTTTCRSSTAAWRREKDKKNPMQAGAAKPAEGKTFQVSLRKDMIVTMDDVKKAKAAGVLLVDNRPEDQFAGINRHPKATESGNDRGAKNLPNGWMTVNGGGEFRKAGQLEQPRWRVCRTKGDQINFCNTATGRRWAGSSRTS